MTKRGSERAPEQECPQCHDAFTLGVNGTVDGCDACCGVSRASNGYVINEPTCACYEKAGDNPACKVHGAGNV